LLFVFTGDDAQQPPPPPDVPEELGRPGVHVAYHQEIWNTHWSRALETLLDAPRIPFVHRRTIGRSLRKRLTATSRMHVHVEPTYYGFRAVSTLDDESAHASNSWIDWLRPNGVVLHIPIPGKAYRQHVYCVPVDDEHTKMMLVTTRDFAIHNPLGRLADLYSLRVMAEDRHVVESIRPMEVPPPVDAQSAARTDRATLEFRKWYWSTLKEGPTTLRRLALS
jgi:hypothetical protein